MPLHQFSQHFQCSAFVSSLRDNALKHLAFVIDGPPKIVPLTVDLHENLVDMPLPWRECTQLLHTPPTDLRCKHRAKPVPPEPDGLVADVDASLVQKVLDIAE